MDRELEKMFQEMTRRLLQATRDRKAHWRETAESNTFRVAFGGGIVEVQGLSGPVVRVTLMNRSGEIIEEADATKHSHPDMRSVFGELFAWARRSAMGTEGLLSKMLDALRQDDFEDLPEPEE